MNQSGLRYSFLLTILLAFVVAASAQFPNPSGLSPKLKVYGGYSGYNPGGKSSGIELGRLPRGWNSGAEVQFTPRYSFFADYGRYANSAATGSTQTYLFGPRFTFHAKALSPFAQVMMGFQRIGARKQPTYTAFSEAIGGGLDVAVANRFSLRLFQADFVYAADHERTKLDLNQFYGVRVSAGIVWNIGSKRRPTVVAKQKPAPAASNEVTTSKPEPEEKKLEAVEEKKTEAPPAEEKPTVAEEKKPEVKVAEEKSVPTEETQPTSTAADQTVETPVSHSKPSVEDKKPDPPASPSSAVKGLEIQSVGTLAFPYEQYPTYLSPQDKRILDAVASRLKLEPESTIAIVGASPRWAGSKAPAQRAVNSKDYLIKKGIAADRVKVLARPTAKSKPAKTELIFVPAGQSFNADSATPVDERHVKAEHLHVAHPEWREK